MRLWHKDLIKALPRQQLLSQWRECCCIARNISVNGTPNHLLVNKILDYPMGHFSSYTRLVVEEMTCRGYKVDTSKFTKYYPIEDSVPISKLFIDWHNYRYCVQCYTNLQEKYDCGGIPFEEWMKIVETFIQIEESESWKYD